MITLIISIISIIFVCLSLYVSLQLAKKVSWLGGLVQVLDNKSSGKSKRSLKNAVKTLYKSFKKLAKQEPIKFIDNTQLSNINLIYKNEQGQYMLLNADGINKDELIEAVEDLGIDFVIEKF